jgi:predicted Zn finger-like uncharacterized protein
MKVVCDNCGAVYKIPEHKLVKEVNKATCRKCGHRIMIRRDAPQRDAEPESGEEATVIAEAAKIGVEQPAAAVAAAPSFGDIYEEPTPLPTSPMDGPPPKPQPSPMPMPTPGAGFGHQPTPQPAPSPAATGVPIGQRSHDPTGDLTVIILGAGAAGVGALLLALAGAHFLAHFMGLFLALLGAFIVVLIVLTGGFGRRPAWVFLSLLLSLLLSGVLSAALNPLTLQLITGDVDFDELGNLAQRMSTAAEQVQDLQPEQPADDGVADAVTDPIPEDEEDPDGAPQDLLDVLATEDPEGDATEGPEGDATEQPEGDAAETQVKEPTTSTPPSSSSSSRQPSSSSGSSSSSSRQPSSSSGSSSSSSRQPSSSSGSSSSSSRQPSSSSGSSSSSSRQPTSSSSSSSSSGQKTIPTTVIDIQIRNNKNIKACFMAHKKSTGELPSVTLRFTLEPDGSVSAASLREVAYQGTALESCLSGSIKLIDFQDFDGPAYTLNYPFRF